MTGVTGTAVVVGGGIAGLAATVALARSGWQVTVLEQAPVFWEAGAGMSVMPNGQAALDGLGLLERVRDHGELNRLGGVRAPDGAWLAAFPDPGWRAIGIHRRSLHAVLLDAANEVADLQPGARALWVRTGVVGGEAALVEWEADGLERAASADLVVGADGARSMTRRLVVPGSSAEPTGFVAWRGVAPVDLLGSDEWALWWGKEAEFAAHRIADGRVSWHCLLSDSGRCTRELMVERLSGWNDVVRGLVAATDELGMFRHDLVEVRPLSSSLSKGRAVLIGDAAHAVLPTLNQGANLAIEDGVALGRLVAETDDLARALKSFERQRHPRVRKVAARSRRMLRLGAGWRGPTVGRDRLVRFAQGRWVSSLFAASARP